ncbi:GlxA family transcriptional regulator [Flocculibacter collagenilyticus]|uniref:GlxA family transcriptional regulator n=1 Tax=Flocculibacter collagenilyticus TaxID=2744479 RepID=UPI0018F771FA|nr:helix-turn-helix domain-containing protein [Flocculibacter collagenilyticus]
MLTIAFPLFEQMLVTGVSGPTEMWQAAEDLARSHRQSIDPSNICTFSQQQGLVKGHGGIKLYADHAYHDDVQCDLIVVAPMWGNPRVGVKRNPELREWLSKQYSGGARIVATGTSVCFLAELGLLNGLVATTHWYYFEHFKRFYPNVELNTHQFITHAKGLYCAGSINSLSDLVLYLIRERYGQHIAGIVERHFSHEINRIFEQPYFTKGGLQHHDEEIIAAQEWAMSCWNEDFSQKRWSEQVGMSERTFSRRFKQSTGMTPLNWLREVKMQKARELLRATNLTIEAIAEHTGFLDAAYFSRLFKKLVSISPKQYRKMVRDKLFIAQQEYDEG